MTDLKQISIPTNCPSCGSDLVQINSQLFCKNKSCPAQSSKKLEAFAKKMRIKGLGPATVTKLGLSHPLELYEADADYYVETLGEKIGNKVFTEIENSKNTTFATFLAALSIPLIGNTASREIAQTHNSIEALIHDTHKNMIGEKARNNLEEWIDENYFDVLDLENYFTFEEPKPSVDKNKGKVCITGKLQDFSNRTKAKDYLEQHGYTVTTTVSSNTDYLVCEDSSNSSKNKKAKELNIPIVTIANLINN